MQMQHIKAQDGSGVTHAWGAPGGRTAMVRRGFNHAKGIIWAGVEVYTRGPRESLDSVLRRTYLDHGTVTVVCAG